MTSVWAASIDFLKTEYPKQQFKVVNHITDAKVNKKT